MHSGMHALVRKLHAAELLHLREHCAELHEENERLRSELAHAEDCAERWHADALHAIEDSNGQPGLTKSGRIVRLEG